MEYVINQSDPALRKIRRAIKKLRCNLLNQMEINDCISIEGNRVFGLFENPKDLKMAEIEMDISDYMNAAGWRFDFRYDETENILKFCRLS